MLHSFYDFQYVFKLPVSHITRLLAKAFEKQEEQRKWEMYVVQIPRMSKENYMSFDEFLKKFEVPKQSLFSHETVQDRFHKMKSRITEGR